MNTVFIGDKKTIFQNKQALVAITLIVACLYSFLYACYGIDMTDAGLHFYMQRNAFNGNGDTWTTIPLTNYIAGAWLALSPRGIRIFFAYLGGVIIYASSIYFALKIYLSFFEHITIKDWLIVVCVILFIPSNRTFINYYSFPEAVSFAFFYYLLKSLKEERAFNWVILGIIGGIVLFSRFTFITLLCVPVFLLLYNLLICKRKLKDIFRLASFYGYGLLITCIPLAILFLLWKTQFSTSASELTLANILYRIKSFLLIVVPIWKVFSFACGLIIIVSFLEHFFSRKIQKMFGKAGIVFSVFIALLLLSYYTAKDRDCYAFFGDLPNKCLVLLIIPSLLFVLLIVCLFGEEATHFCIDSKIEKPFLVTVCLFSLAVPLGSDVSYCKLGHMAPVYLMIIGGLLLHRLNQDYPLRFPIYLSILFFGIIVRPLYSYLDAPILRCYSVPSFPGLHFLHTTKARAEDWDSLLYALERESRGEQEVLMVGYLNFGPLYLLDLQDWNHGTCTGDHNFMKRFHENKTKKELPEIAFVDEKSEEYLDFKDILEREYIPVYSLSREHYNYSIWRKNDN